MSNVITIHFDVQLCVHIYFTQEKNDGLNLQKNGQEREVVHLQFTAWPDEGCPVSAIEFIQFHQKYRTLTKGRLGLGPTIVHCT